MAVVLELHNGRPMYDTRIDGELEAFLDDTRDQLRQLVYDLVSIDSQIPSLF